MKRATRSTSPKTVTRQTHIAEQIMGRLRSLPPGAKIPSVRELMAEFKASQLIVSQAMGQLRERGYIVARVGHGTYVTERGANLPVLWVCGIDVFHGQVSSYWGHCFREAEVALRAQGITIEPVWLSNCRPEDAEAYLSRMALDRYRGFLFVGCGWGHPLLNAVRDAGLPFVELSHQRKEAHQLTADRRRMVDMAMARFESLGRRNVTVLRPEAYEHAVLEAAARAHGIQLRRCALPRVRFHDEIRQAAYETTKRLMEARELGDTILAVDDVVAQGAAQALLECCSARELADMRVVVMTTLQQVAALGVPVDYVAYDVRDMMEYAVDMLRRQWEDERAPVRWIMPCHLVLNQDVANVAMVARRRRYATTISTPAGAVDPQVPAGVKKVTVESVR